MSDQLKTVYQFSRIAIGCAALFAPGLFGRLAYDGAGTGTESLLSRMAGVRDISLGLGQVLGERHGSARGFYEAAVLADLSDVATFSLAGVKGDLSKPKAALCVALAASGVALGIWFARSGGGADDLDAELAELTRTAATVEDMG